MFNNIKSHSLLYKRKIYTRYTENFKYIIGMFSSNTKKTNKYKENRINKMEFTKNTLTNNEDSFLTEA